MIIRYLLVVACGVWWLLCLCLLCVSTSARELASTRAPADRAEAQHTRPSFTTIIHFSYRPEKSNNNTREQGQNMLYT